MNPFTDERRSEMTNIVAREVHWNVSFESVSFYIVDSGLLSIAEFSPMPIDLVERTLQDFDLQMETGEDAPWWWFNRLNVPRQLRRRGFATALMESVDKWATDCGVWLFNGINPYGEMTLEQLVEFYKRYHFESLAPSVMVRRHGLLQRFTG